MGPEPQGGARAAGDRRVGLDGRCGRRRAPATTKLDLAKRAADRRLDEFKPDDDVGLRIFSTDISRTEPTDYLDLVPIGPIGAQREADRAADQRPHPDPGHAAVHGHEGGRTTRCVETFDAERINAVVLLTDGTQRGRPQQRPRRAAPHLRARNEGQVERPVRDLHDRVRRATPTSATLKRIAEATNAAAYNAADPTTINKVFIAVVSNF